MNTQTDLTDLMISLTEAGRADDAAAVARTIKLNAEVGEWIACLRCGMSFPTIPAKAAHDRIHRNYRAFGRSLNQSR